MKTIRSLFNREDTAGIMFTLPFTLGFLFFMIVPMGISLYYSFCKYNFSTDIYILSYGSWFHDGISEL